MNSRIPTLDPSPSSRATYLCTWEGLFRVWPDPQHPNVGTGLVEDPQQPSPVAGRPVRQQLRELVAGAINRGVQRHVGRLGQVSRIAEDGFLPPSREFIPGHPAEGHHWSNGRGLVDREVRAGRH